ncbi:hypothetical protein FHG87_009792 [Trinorchestia longiramus]|nr:hypothetical protein FHG87_009792 [Trinorchestia longiramus]
MPAAQARLSNAVVSGALLVLFPWWTIGLGDRPIRNCGVKPILGVSTIEAGKIEAGKIEAGKIEAGKIEAGKIEAGKIEAGKIEAGKIEAGKIEVGKIEAGKIEAGKIEAGKIEASPIEASGITLSQIKLNKTKASWLIPCNHDRSQLARSRPKDPGTDLQRSHRRGRSNKSGMHAACSSKTLSILIVVMLQARSPSSVLQLEVEAHRACRRAWWWCGLHQASSLAAAGHFSSRPDCYGFEPGPSRIASGYPHKSANLVIGHDTRPRQYKT